MDSIGSCLLIFEIWFSVPLPQVYNNNKHAAIKSTFTNICERMDYSKELAKLKCGTLIACQCCNKSVHETSSAVSGVIAKWNRLGATSTPKRLLRIVSHTLPAGN